MSRDGLFRRSESVNRVFVIKGIVKRFAMASMRNALRIVEPFRVGSGAMLGLAAGVFAEGILVNDLLGRMDEGIFFFLGMRIVSWFMR